MAIIEWPTGGGRWVVINRQQAIGVFTLTKTPHPQEMNLCATECPNG